MWKKMDEISKEDMSSLRYLKKAKLYADEDIEEAIVEFLKNRGTNIISARELGYRGKPDSFHAAFSLKQKRFLLTKNGKHFMDDRKFPFNRIHGIIVIQGDMNNIREYVRTLNRLNDIIEFGEVYYGGKIRISPNETSVRLIDRMGQIKIHRYKSENNNHYEWINN